MVKAIKLVFVLPILVAVTVYAQNVPEDELQVNLNSYFDSFRVDIFYPSLSFTKRLTDSSSVNVRYLVDVISAASMRSLFKVDGVTSATDREDGGGDDSPDEVRHELGAGISQSINGGTVTVNALYSREHDYRSITLAGTYAHPFAKKNTTLQLGLVRSWDKIFPQIRDWKKSKDTYTGSLNLTQILSKRLIAQAIFSYSLSKGFLSDPYQVIQIIENDQVVNYEPVHPDERTRKAAGLRMNYKVERKSALQIGFRYYWDDWEVNSFTTSVSFQQHVSDAATVGLSFRNYFQDRAFFFKANYTSPEQFMTVDSKLDEGYSNEYQFKLILNGAYLDGVPFLNNEHIQVNFDLNFYHRQTATPNWYSRAKDLFAYILSLGVRYRFR